MKVEFTPPTGLTCRGCKMLANPDEFYCHAFQVPIDETDPKKCQACIDALLDEGVFVPPPTPERFAEMMSELHRSDDQEARHGEMDRLMCAVLQALGYEDGVKVFDATKKWYA